VKFSDATGLTSGAELGNHPLLMTNIYNLQMSTNSKTLETRPSDNFNAEFKDPDIWYSSSICNRMDCHWHTHRTSHNMSTLHNECPHIPLPTKPPRPTTK
jgi:hypothetical protein